MTTPHIWLVSLLIDAIPEEHVNTLAHFDTGAIVLGWVDEEEEIISCLDDRTDKQPSLVYFDSVLAVAELLAPGLENHGETTKKWFSYTEEKGWKPAKALV